MIQSSLGKCELGVLRTLQQQLAVDQALEGRFAQHFLVEQRGIEILAQLLHQLTALHINRLAELALTDFFTIDLGRVLAVASRLEYGFDTGESHQYNDDPDNGFGNPAL